VGPRVDLNAMMKKQNPLIAPCQVANPDRPDRSVVAMTELYFNVNAILLFMFCIFISGFFFFLCFVTVI
jgi:hypothetical protein